MKLPQKRMTRASCLIVLICFLMMSSCTKEEGTIISRPAVPEAVAPAPTQSEALTPQPTEKGTQQPPATSPIAVTNDSAEQTEPAQKSDNDPNHFADFWDAFKAAFIDNDIEQLKSMTQFPIQTRGSYDFDPIITFEEDQYDRLMSLCFKDAKTEYWDAHYNRAVEQGSIGDIRASLCHFNFSFTDGVWKLNFIYLNDKDYDQLFYPLSAQDNDIVNSYTELLNALDKKGRYSISYALEKYSGFAVLSDSIEKNNRMFRLFKTFFNEVQNNISPYISLENMELITEESADGNYYNIIDQAVIEKLDNLQLAINAVDIKSNGFVIYWSESDDYLGENPLFLLNEFSDSVSDGIGEYLKLRNNDLKIGCLTEDSALAISWDALSDKVIAWEKYAGKYSDMPEAEEAVKNAENYLSFYLTANFMDNTPMFNNGILTDELRASYKRFIDTYPDSKYCGLVTGYYAVLEKNGFALTQEAKDYLKKFGYEFWDE